MHVNIGSKAWNRLGRIAALGVGGLLLAGCATGYSLVQPEAAGSGSYYTSSEPYSGNGYYDYYGTGPYYAGTSGWGYYNGTSPYSSPFGWYGGYYGGGDWPWLTFNLGISNVWGFPGYWGPWYSTSFPIWNCAGRGCDSWRHHRHHRRNGKHGHIPSHSPQPWLRPDHPPVPRIANGRTPPIRVPDRPLAVLPSERFASRLQLESAAFVRQDFMRAPIRRRADAGFRATQARPIDLPRIPNERAFANRRPLSMPIAMPRGFDMPPRMPSSQAFTSRGARQQRSTPVAHPVFRSAPISMPVVAPPARSARPAGKTRIR